MIEKLETDGNNDEVVSFISEVSIFKELSYDSLKKISEKIQEESFVANSTIIKKDFPGLHLYLIKSGCARVVEGTEEGDEFTVATIPEGACFGEMSLLTGDLCSATVKTNEDSLLYFITKNDFDDILTENPLIYKHFNKVLSDRICQQNIKSLNLKKHEIELNRYLQKTKEHQYDHVIGNCKRMRKVLQEAENFSKIDLPVTLIGEQGTGKELLARKIHTDSARTKYPIIEIALPTQRRNTAIQIKHEERRKRDSVECDLFGSEKGAFSDEIGKRIGRFELVDRGTLLIKNVENLSSGSQARLLKFLKTGVFSRVGGDKPILANVRILATTTDLDLMKINLEEELFNTLTTHTLKNPPLSEHKKDIPDLMEYFSYKICKAKHFHTKKFSKGATNKLLKYNYPGNVKELENVILRAFELTKDSETIEEEEIFIGESSIEEKNRFNLLSIPLFKFLCKSTNILLTVKKIILISFILLLGYFVVQPDIIVGGKDISLILCWQIAVPGMFLFYLLAARFGCGLCPISFISDFITKYANFKVTIPSFIKKNDVWIMGMGFIFILFIEGQTDMSHSITKTAYLLFSILFAAIIISIVFEKAAWCRHFCPLGALGGFFSMASMIEIRSNRNVCTTICTTHDCYKGTEKVAPCPMFLHLQFLSDNRLCKVCLNCIKNCKHHATRLNLRIPGAEISLLEGPSLAGPFMSVILYGILVADILHTINFTQLGFPIVFVTSIFFALILNMVSSCITGYLSNDRAIDHFKYFGYTMMPLTLFGFIAFKLIEVVGNAKGSLMLFNICKLNFSITYIIQFCLICIGLFITEYLIYKLAQNKIKKNTQLWVFIIQGTIALIFSAIFLSLFYNSSGPSFGN